MRSLLQFTCKVAPFPDCKGGKAESTALPGIQTTAATGWAGQCLTVPPTGHLDYCRDKPAHNTTSSTNAYLGSDEVQQVPTS